MTKLGETYGGGSDLFKGKESVEGDPILTIKGVRTHIWKEEGKDDRPQWMLSFEESDLEFGLNWTNVVSVADICVPDVDINDVEDTDLIGGKIQLYWDRTVKFGPKLVGGIRVRPPSGTAPDTAEATWGDESAKQFMDFLHGRIADCSDPTMDNVVSEIGNRAGLSGSNPAEWPVSQKRKTLAVANDVVKEIAEGDLDLDEISVPF